MGKGTGHTLGFTLVELLVAMALLGLLGVISVRGLDYVVGQRERVDRETEDVSRMLRVLAQLERDVAQRAPDALLGISQGPRLLPASLTVSSRDRGAVAFEILRIAPGSGGPTRVQRIIYRIDGMNLTRSASPAGASWPVAPASAPVAMLHEVRQLVLRAFTGGAWVDLSTGGRMANEVAPASGLEVTIRSRDGGQYTRVFAL